MSYAIYPVLYDILKKDGTFMITSDYGFSIVNYIGHYKIIDDNGLRIVSEEYHPARGSEKELNTITLFVDDFKNNDYLLIALANVDIKKDSDIIGFCNKYGLPYSSAKINDEQPGYYIWGLDVDEATYARWDPYYQQDTMSRFEFCRHASSAKRLLNVKAEIEATKRNPHAMLQYLLPLLLLDRRHLYELNEDDLTPETPTGRFQWYFLSVFEREKKKDEKISFIVALLYFIQDIQDTCKNLYKHPISEQRLKDYKSSDWNNLFQLLLEVMKLNTRHLNEITFDDFGNITLPRDLEITESLQTYMYTLAPQILMDMINEGLIKVHPTLFINSKGKFAADWLLKYQYEGLLLEIFLMLSSGSQLRKCANPTCEKFFSPSSHSDKMFCTQRCASLVAKRRQRMRDKENPDRERLKAGFQSKQLINKSNAD